MVFDGTIYICICAVASVGIALNILSLVLHLSLPMLLKHPGSLILVHMLCEIVVLAHWFIINPNKTMDLSKDSCKMIGMISIFFYYAGWFYILFLYLEVYIILRYKAYTSAKVRLRIYNIFALIFSALLVFAFYLTDSIGETFFKSCFISKDSIGRYLDFSFSSALIVLLIIIYILIKKQLGGRYSRAFHHLTHIILIYVLTVIFSRCFSLLLLLQKVYLHGDTTPTIVLGAISSMTCSSIVALLRILHPKIRSKLRELCPKRVKTKKPELKIPEENQDDMLKVILKSSFDATSDDLSDMFERLGHKILIQILILLTIKYKIDEDHCLDLNQAIERFRGRKEKKEFDESMYIHLAHDLSMPFIEKVYSPQVYLLEYESGIFEAIRKSSGFSRINMIESLLSYENLSALSQIENKGGRSNAFFYTSSNEKIVIKTIDNQECLSFLKFLPKYSKRVFYHPESKLVRIFGLFRILPHMQDFIIMENAILKRHGCLIYDLKGSTVDRYVNVTDCEFPPCGLVLKDMNFTKVNKKIRIKNRDAAINSIIKDMKILRRCRLMDYSMLVGVYNFSPNLRYALGDGYSLAIIDFFQRYGFKKSMERIFKRCILRKDKGISTMSPNRYFKRIKKYLISITEEDSEETYRSEGSKN